MKSRMILAAGMLMLASALARAEEKPPIKEKQEPVAAPAPAPESKVPVASAAVPCCRAACHDPFQRFQDWLTFCPQRTPCCGHCCGCAPACPPLYTYFLDHCGNGYGHNHAPGCGCGAAPVASAVVPVAPAPCETCSGGWWHRLLGH